MPAKTFTLCFARWIFQKENNADYPERITIRTSEDLRNAARWDHVAALYKNDHRSNDNFLSSDALIMDADNDEVNKRELTEAEWITPAKVADLTHAEFYAVESRSSRKIKNGFSPRPRYHFYFPLSRTYTDADEYSALKIRFQAIMPALDPGARDAARFLFGVQNPQPEYWPGERCIDEWLQEQGQTDPPADTPADTSRTDDDGRMKWDDFICDGPSWRDDSPITEGSRNDTCFHEALRLLVYYGPDEYATAARIYSTEVLPRCNPPLSAREAQQVFASAAKRAREVAWISPGYLPRKKLWLLKTRIKGELLPDHFTDVDQGAVFVREYGDIIRYSRQTGWLVFDGRRWTDDQVQPLALAKTLTDLQLTDARNRLEAAQTRWLDARDKIDRDGKNMTADQRAAVEKVKAEADAAREAAEGYRAFVLKRRSDKLLHATLNVSAPDVPIRIEDLDADPELLNTAAGTVDLRTGILREHRPGDYLTCMTAEDLPEPSAAGAAMWNSFLDTITCGDPELAAFLQEIAGMAAYGKVMSETLVIAYGTGRNGKSTTFNVLARILGSYSTTLSSEIITLNTRTNAKAELATLRGKRFAIAAELREGTRLSSATLKQIASTDRIHCEPKYKDPYDFLPTHSIVLFTNFLPRVSELDDGTWRRLCVFPFDAVIPASEAQEDFAEQLFNVAGGNILDWIIEGAGRYIAGGFKLHPPARVVSATDVYRTDTDWLGDFLENCCTLKADAQDTQAAVWRAYQMFAQETGTTYCKDRAGLREALTARGFILTRTGSSGSRVVKGLTVLPRYKATTEGDLSH